MHHKARVAVIDDDAAVVDVIRAALRHDGIEAAGFPSAHAFLAAPGEPYDLVLCDLQMPGMTGLELLLEVRRKDSRSRFVIITGEGSVPTAVEAMKKGATDFLAKPLRLEEIRMLVRLLDSPRYPPCEDAPTIVTEPDFAVGRAPAWRRLLEKARLLADLPVTVLIRGETGSGKEVLARYLASVGPRAGKPFVAINCAAVPEQLLESELFGHARGAFSGAETARRGLFEEADGGMLFLDEAGSMGLPAQGKLLRVIEERKVRRLGENHWIDVDVRIVAATHSNLEKAVACGAFRADLYFRLAVVTLAIPPLRERAGDVPLLAAHFVKARTKPGEAPKRLSLDALELLARYPFPGNIRELRNAVEQALIFSTGPELTAGDFDQLASRGLTASLGPGPRVGSGEALAVTLEKVQEALLSTRGNRVEAAKLLGVSRSTLYRVLRHAGALAETS